MEGNIESLRAARQANKEISEGKAARVMAGGVKYQVEVIEGRQFCDGVEAFCIIHTLARPQKITLCDFLNEEQRVDLLAEAIDRQAWCFDPVWAIVNRARE